MSIATGDFNPKPEEKIIKRADSSLAAKIVFWVSVPAYVLIAYIPTIDLGLIRLIAAISEDAEKVIRIVSAVIIAILATVWICFCLVATKRQTNGFLLLTDSRVLGKQDDRMLNESIGNITDVYIEQSLYGKIFGYATLTVTTTGYNLTVKNLAGGAEMRKAILDAAKIKYY